MKKNRQATNPTVLLMTTALLMMLVGLPAHANGEASESVVFEETPVVFDDNDALGRYGDENDEEVIDEVTTSRDSADTTNIVTKMLDTGNSSVIANSNPDYEGDSGYEENQEDEGDV